MLASAWVAAAITGAAVSVAGHMTVHGVVAASGISAAGGAFAFRTSFYHCGLDSPGSARFPRHFS